MWRTPARLSWICAPLSLVVCAVARPVAAQETLLDRYAASPPELVVGELYPVDFTAADIWRVRDLDIRFGPEHRLSAGSARIVIAHHRGHAVCAYVEPERGGHLVHPEASDGEPFRCAVIRFHPSALRTVVPRDAVHLTEAGDLLARAERAMALKARLFRGEPGYLVTAPGWMALNADTEAEVCRLFASDSAKGTVDYFPDRGSLTLPPIAEISPEEALLAFDRTWTEFDETYAMFVIKPDVDWAALRQRYRPQAGRCQTAWQLTTVLSRMVGHLRDWHVKVRLKDHELTLPFQLLPPVNASREALTNYLAAKPSNDAHIRYGSTPENIGYIAVDALQNEVTPDAFSRALEHLKDTNGLVLDIRACRGGSEPAGWAVARRFTDEPRVYAWHRLRADKSRHDSLQDPVSRRFRPGGPWQYERPIEVLWGPRTASSAEALALMLRQCPQVETMGADTRGSSGRPRALELDHGIAVNVPTWLALDAEKQPFEGIGLAPDIRVEPAPEEFTPESDPVLAAALDRLRERTTPVTFLISPDGTQLAWGIADTSAGGEVATRAVVCRIDGSGRREVAAVEGNHDQVLWLGNDRLAVTMTQDSRRRHYTVVDLTRSTSKPLLVVPEPNRAALTAFSPYANLVTFIGAAVDDDEACGRLYLYDTGTGEIRGLLGPGVDTLPTWSPDGTAFCVGVSPDGRQPHRLMISEIGAAQAGDLGVEGVGAVWSPSGRFIACTTEVLGGVPEAVAARIDRVPIYGRVGVYDLLTKAVTPVSPPPRVACDPTTGSCEVGGCLAPVWSPDQEWIAYRRVVRRHPRDGSQTTESDSVWVVARDGTRSHKVLGRAAQVAWGPGSQYLYCLTSSSVIRVETQSLVRETMASW